MFRFASVSSPVDRYYQCLEGAHTYFKSSFPVSYCMYKSLIPHRDYDILELIQKVTDVVFLYFVIGWGAMHITFFFWFLPFVPLLIDLIYLSSKHI